MTKLCANNPRRSRLRDISVVLAVKLAALGVLYFAFFSPSHRMAMTAERTAQLLLSGASRIRNN